MVSNNESTCPACGGYLKYYDKVGRIVRSKMRHTKWIGIRRMKCRLCGRLHRELPDYIYPYKQYEAEIIRGVLDGIITPDTIGYEDYPCERTMEKWIREKNIPYNGRR